MITAVVGAGGKTTLIHQMAAQYRQEGKRVLVVTSTHMLIEPDTLLTDAPDVILNALDRTGYAMAGTPCGEKIAALPETVYLAACAGADEVLVEADGSKHLPIKHPRAGEPVIPANADRIIVVCGLHALNKPLQEVAFRLDEVTCCLGVPAETIVTPSHIQTLVRKGYVEPLKAQYPDKIIEIHAAHDGSMYQRALAALLEADMDVNLINEAWFAPKPWLILCGAGHVALEIAHFAARLDFRIKVIDDRPDFADPARFPMAEQVICDGFDHLQRYLEPDAYYVVVTPGHENDVRCVGTIVNTPYRYLGMIGSRGKVAHAFDTLTKAGVSQERLDTIHAPIGLAIGAVTPAEIAVSILAQIIQEKNRFSAASASSEMLNCTRHGMLCIIIEKKGSAPRGVGSMMLVNEDAVLDTIGGGPVEYAAIQDARACQDAAIRDYILNNQAGARLGMVCGGSNKVLFLPV